MLLLIRLKLKENNRSINFDLNRSANCLMIAPKNANQGATFSITDTKLYNSIITSSTKHNSNLLEQLKSRFKRTINWNKHQPKVSKKVKKQYLH